jgi:serine/threonine-protein kinase HipA
MELTLETFVDGAWEHAATLDLVGDAHRSQAELSYEQAYLYKHDPLFTGEVIDRRALSVRLPLTLFWDRLATWPPFVLDFLPQGHARQVIAKSLDIDPDAGSADGPLLLRTGGSPIGNIRVREAWERERIRNLDYRPQGLSLDQVFALEDGFLELADQFAAAASGSSGVQGAWPKLLLTLSSDGLWYPDSLVADDEARDYVIVKWIGDRKEETSLILEAEAPYLEVARWFGIRCARPLQHRNGMLLIPRFDRRVSSQGVERLGQESLVSAAGFAEFGHEEKHETYLEVIRTYCDDPFAEVTEYVLRDLLNLAMGNPDNHGRNTALQKDIDGTLRLSPLFDFCPMKMDPTGIRRSTKWGCMARSGGGTQDLNPDWALVCEVACGDKLPAEELKKRVAAKGEVIARLPEVAKEKGVPTEVIARAMGRCAELAAAVRRLSDSHDAS